VALEKNISRFVHISSVAALGRKKSGDHLNEEKKWEENKMNTHYAISKYRAEMEIWRAMGEGLNAVIVNPSILLGYGDWNETSCRMFKSFYHEFPWYTTGVNGFADVEDAAKAIVLLMETTISEERFIINNDNWSFQKLFTAIAEGFEKKPPSRNVSPFLSGLAWRSEKIKSFFTGQKPLLTKESARLAHSNTWFENEKILNALPGFTFTPLQETIRTACKKYLMQP
jgi:nucleoside-diphosphate-sugar epimerase